MTQNSLKAAKAFLKKKKIAYTEKNGVLTVSYDIRIERKDLVKGMLPDLSDVVVQRNFYCNNIDLTSLKGSPQTVGGDFDCSWNQLTSLEHAPQTVGGSFECSSNKLTSLEGSPQRVGENFYCDFNQLTSLEGSPQQVGGNFSCSENKLTSLEGSPQQVGGNFSCSENKLTSLEGSPQRVGGNFYCYSNQLTSLEHAPQTVGGSFDCFRNKLTSLEPLRNCDIKGSISAWSNPGLGSLAINFDDIIQLIRYLSNIDWVNQIWQKAEPKFQQMDEPVDEGGALKESRRTLVQAMANRSVEDHTIPENERAALAAVHQEQQPNKNSDNLAAKDVKIILEAMASAKITQMGMRQQEASQRLGR